MTQLLHSTIVPRLGPRHSILLWKASNLRLGNSSTATPVLTITPTTPPQHQPPQV